MTVRIGINGIGRIGRATLRISLNNPELEVVAINDINPDISNVAYLIRYDSTYGRLGQSVQTENDTIVIGNEKRIRYFQKDTIDAVPWQEAGVDVVIDASGIKKNLLLARNLRKAGVKRVIVTNSPSEKDVDLTLIMGVNHEAFDPAKHFLVSSSICDANAFGPVAHVLHQNFGIDHGFLTTLHPWLNYQNLLCGPSISYATPGELHDYYALGRSNIGSLIPKTTSAISATCKSLPELNGKFLSMSFRIPTMIVSTADISVKLAKKTDVETVKALFEAQEARQKWKIFYNNKEALISADFTQTEYSAVVDHRWIMVNEQNYLKMVLWYDNEWGYSSRVADVAAYVGGS